MTRPRRIQTALFLLTLVSTAACGPETVRPVPSPSAAPTSTLPTTSAPTRTATPVPTTPVPTAVPSPAPTPAPTTSPGSSPNPPCAPLAGGSPLAASTLVTIRVAHQPGFDRVVFEWSGPAVPEYRIALASTFTAPSGQAVRVDGNAFFSVRMNGQAHTDAGAKSYAQPDPYRVGLPVVREVKLVEDFEGVLIFGLGMERVVCPTVLTLLGPARVVIDFPTPP